VSVVRAKVRLPSRGTIEETRALLASLELHTVCQAADCPNRWECFGSKTAAFMILGDVCTRGCGFCAVRNGTPRAVDPDEPARIAAAVVKLGLQYVVVTSVTRDDLADGGAGQFVRVIESVRAAAAQAALEVLVPDFGGEVRALDLVCAAQPTVFNHNIETVRRLAPEVRRGASYERSLAVLSYAARHGMDMPVKSGIMVGLGEQAGEVEETLHDLRCAGCTMVTIGQYFAPSADHYPVRETIADELFARYRACATALGFRVAAAGPLVRSSYHAAEDYHAAWPGAGANERQGRAQA
jgi:lipoic acid synthetase